MENSFLFSINIESQGYPEYDNEGELFSAPNFGNWISSLEIDNCVGF